MPRFSKSRYVLRIAETNGDLDAAQQLRRRAFSGRDDGGRDVDRFDPICTHFLIECRDSGQVVGCFRILPLKDGSQIGNSYSAQFYELSALAEYSGPMVELGRFCIDPTLNDPDILRIAWSGMTRYVDDHGVEMLFGCSSFAGTDAESYLDAFTMLHDRYLAPKRWLPRVKAPDVFRFATRLTRKPNPTQAQRNMPPLLKTYLMMGGWVSDHAVVDSHMNTLHVFTGVEINAIPPQRRRLLRALAA